MNIYLILSTVLVGMICAIIGMVMQAFIDNKETRELLAKIEKLETENTLLIGEVKPERVEVIHRHVIENKAKSDVDFSQKW